MAAVMLPWLAALQSGPAAAQAESPVPEKPSPANDIPEVVVQAPEPRYVAPTQRDRIGRIWAPVYINDQGPFRLVLDTGANRSAINEAVARRLGLTSVTGPLIALQGVTGTRNVAAVTVRSFVVGDLALGPARLPVIADALGGAEGVLGTDGLLDKRISIDFRHDRITVARSHREHAGLGFLTIPVRLNGGLMTLPGARIGSLPVTAVVDTGGQLSIANPALVEALRRRQRRDRDNATEIIGTTLDVERGELLALPALTVGPLKVSLPRLVVADAYIFGYWKFTSRPVILLGMDVLGWFDTLIIDYKLRELQIRLTG
jgi:hypothetical protein